MSTQFVWVTTLKTIIIRIKLDTVLSKSFKTNKPSMSHNEIFLDSLLLIRIQSTCSRRRKTNMVLNKLHKNVGKMWDEFQLP